jgi:hypothetical protein
LHSIPRQFVVNAGLGVWGSIHELEDHYAIKIIQACGSIVPPLATENSLRCSQDQILAA